VTQTLFTVSRPPTAVRVAELQVQSGREALRKCRTGRAARAVHRYTNVLANQSLVDAQRSNVAFCAKPSAS